MKVSLNWINELARTTLSAGEVAERLTMTSSEVDGWSDLLTIDERIVSARVLSVQPHPNAERLRLVTVSYGSREHLRVVCGAPNVEVGAYVVLALPGARVHGRGGWQLLKEGEIRGVASKGMLCSLAEVGLPSSGEGIFCFPAPVPVGKPLAHLLGSDTVLEVAITANRPDLLGHVGLARELAAAVRKPWKEPTVPPVPAFVGGTAPTIRVESPGVASVHTAHLSLTKRGVTPLRILARLQAAGIRAIHPVVDVLNYVMLEYGQPLHAYDATRFGSQLTIATLKEPVTFLGLNGQSYELAAGDLVSTNVRGEIGDIVGILGSQEHAVHEGTSEILLKVGTFPAATLRRTGRRLGLRTDALARFEKFLPTGLAHIAFRRALELLQEICGAELCGPTAHYTGQEGAGGMVSLTFHQAEQLLGAAPSPAETRTILERLGFAIVRMTKSGLTVRPPYWRRDIALPEDLIEELARIWGYERIPSDLPVGPLAAPTAGTPYDQWHLVRRGLARSGIRECIFHPFASAAELKLFGLDAPALLQPLSSELAHLAPSNLIRLVLDTARVEPQATAGAWFCSGGVFPEGIEERTVAILIRDADPVHAVRLLNRAVAGVVRSLGYRLDMSPYSSQPAFLEPGEAVQYRAGERVIGFGGRAVTSLTPKARNAPETLLAELSLDALASLPVRAVAIDPVLDAPSHTRDLTYAWDAPASTILEQLEAVPTPPGVRRSIALVATYTASEAATLTFRVQFTPMREPISETHLAAWMRQFPKPLS